MAGYVRELLVDLASGKLDDTMHTDVRCDLLSCIQRLVDTKQVDAHDILCLDKFLAGFSLADLTIIYVNAAERLSKTLALIEYTSGYTDESFLSKMMSKYPTYKGRAPELRTKLHLYGRIFE